MNEDIVLKLIDVFKRLDEDGADEYVAAGVVIAASALGAGPEAREAAQRRGYNMAWVDRFIVAETSLT